LDRIKTLLMFIALLLALAVIDIVGLWLIERWLQQ
jgi:hypothetical protein